MMEGGEKMMGKEAAVAPRAGWTAAALAAMLLLCLLAPAAPLGCGGTSAARGGSAREVEAAVTAFLDALGDRDVENLRSFFTQDYLDSKGVPDPITPNGLTAAFGVMESYRMVPEEDISVDGDRAAVTVTLDMSGKEEKEDTLIMSRTDGEWKVDDFTAMDWVSQPVLPDEGSAAVEVALRNFLIACVDARTDYIFENLSPGYKEKHRLEKPWTAAEFSGVFGTARSYDFDAAGIGLQGETAAVDVTVEFGSRGNLESETSRVRLVKDGKSWLIDVFPFFIY